MVDCSDPETTPCRRRVLIVDSQTTSPMLLRPRVLGKNHLTLSFSETQVPEKPLFQIHTSQNATTPEVQNKLTLSHTLRNFRHLWMKFQNHRVPLHIKSVTLRRVFRVSPLHHLLPRVWWILHLSLSPLHNHHHQLRILPSPSCLKAPSPKNSFLNPLSIMIIHFTLKLHRQSQPQCLYRCRKPAFFLNHPSTMIPTSFPCRNLPAPETNHLLHTMALHFLCHPTQPSSLWPIPHPKNVKRKQLQINRKIVTLRFLPKLIFHLLMPSLQVQKIQRPLPMTTVRPLPLLAILPTSCLSLIHKKLKTKKLRSPLNSVTLRLRSTLTWTLLLLRLIVNLHQHLHNVLLQLALLLPHCHIRKASLSPRAK